MLDLTKTLTDGAILGVVSTVYILALVIYNPRLFLGKNDVPPDILAAVPPKTEREKRLSLLLGIPFLLLSLVFPVWSAFTFDARFGGGAPFIQIFLHTLVVILFPFFMDLILLDWLLLNTITPKFLVIPGTEGLAGWKDYGFHLRVHTRALLYLVAVALVVSAVVRIL